LNFWGSLWWGQALEQGALSGGQMKNVGGVGTNGSARNSGRDTSLKKEEIKI